MNELQTAFKQLPDTLDDLAKFTLIGREKLNAVRAEIRAIEKVGLAKEVHEQKLQEAQEIAEAVLDAEAKIGELTARMEKAANQYASNSGVTTKNEQLDSIGISKMQASRYETLAKHPEMVEQAKADARERGEIVTRQSVLDKITDKKRAEIDTFRKQQERELREAKQRHEDFQEQKSDGVISLNAVKQDKEDAKLLYEDLEDYCRGINKEMNYVGSLLINGELNDILRGADQWALRDLDTKIRNWHSILIGVRRAIEEVIHEK